MSGCDLTLCVCTSGRPVELARCLASIAAGSKLPGAVIVSDDSAKPGVAKQVQDVCGRYDFVTYVEGPRRGLCANRNHVIRQATTSHVSLIDDDGVVSADFIERALEAARRFPGNILSGDVLEDGVHRHRPSNPRFLGHFGRPIRPGEPIRNIQLNCNVIPREVFDVTAFDENIAYGYEDTDWCAQALAAGYHILHLPELVNQHLPASRPVLGSERRLQTERARFYVTIRRHARWDLRAGRLLAFLAVAPVHLALHAVRTRQWRLIVAGWLWALADLRGARA